MFKNISKILVKFYIRVFRYVVYKISQSLKTTRLGSIYGGWNFIEDNSFQGQTIISGGCGEDISFDIEFLNLYMGRVILVDPTPRSINHLEKVFDGLGNTKTKDYVEGGNQPISAYDLSKITSDQIEVEEFALYDKNNVTVKFFPPKNLEHVSYSISNWQNVDEETDYQIEVETITVKDIIKKYDIDSLKLIKLDIEGAAENQVLPFMIKEKIFPEQILVEFDELHTGNLKPYLKASKIIFQLLINGYKLIETNKFPDMLFVKKEILKLKNDNE